MNNEERKQIANAIAGLFFSIAAIWLAWPLISWRLFWMLLAWSCAKEAWRRDWTGYDS